MLNPSTADASRDDPTIRRCVGFARRWRFGGVVVVNLFALRATEPRALREALRPIGRANDRHIRRAAARAAVVVIAWGAHGVFGERARAVERMLSRRELRCLGRTRSGEPRHPLYLRRDARVVAVRFAQRSGV